MQLNSEDIVRAIDDERDARYRILLKARREGGTPSFIAGLEGKLAGLGDARRIVLVMAERAASEMASFYAECGHE